MTTIPVWRYENGSRFVLHNVQVTSGITLSDYTWYKHGRTRQVFATHLGKRVYLSDVIKGEKGPWIHINGNPLDFRNQNLVKGDIRTVKYTRGTSNTVGVCFVERRNRWKVTLAGKLIGYFKTEEEAIQARLRAVLTLNPMIRFVPEGTDPDGPSGMNNREIYHAEGGKPDVYLDVDMVEETPVSQYPFARVSTQIKDWKNIPPHIDLAFEQPEDLETRRM